MKAAQSIATVAIAFLLTSTSVVAYELEASSAVESQVHSTDSVRTELTLHATISAQQATLVRELKLRAQQELQALLDGDMIKRELMKAASYVLISSWKQLQSGV